MGGDGVGYRVQGVGCRVWGAECKVQGARCRVESSGQGFRASEMDADLCFWMNVVALAPGLSGTMCSLNGLRKSTPHKNNNTLLF